MRTVHFSANPIATLDSTIEQDYPVSSWRHKITANIGFDTASFNLIASKRHLEEMFAEGCGRRITRYTSDGQSVVWDGYVSEMTLNEPGLQMRISLREMANSIIVKYTPTDTSTNPPTYAAETWTTPVNDAASQAKYGVKQKVFIPPMNKLTAADAVQHANVMLAHYRMPMRSGLAASSSDEFGLQMSCEGYAHTLDWRTYNQTILSGADNASTVMSTIVTATGQEFIADQDFYTNTTQIQKYFLNYDTGYDLVQLISNLGDSSNSRWLAYVLEDRILHYEMASITVDYYRRIEDGRQEIRDISGRLIPFWEVRPNHWMRTTDIFPYALTPASLKDDFQAMFVESVEWSEEQNTIAINGSAGDDLQVIIARLAARGDRML